MSITFKPLNESHFPLLLKWLETYTRIFADPDSSNIAAIKAYEKAGFKMISEQQDTGEV